MDDAFDLLDPGERRIAGNYLLDCGCRARVCCSVTSKP
jgi:hypothetical protein